MFSFPVLLVIYAGFIHAFEADHLLAVSSIVSRRTDTGLSMKDGIFWGLGHASTICCIGIIMIIFKTGISPVYFRYFEAFVGIMLVALAIYRLATVANAGKPAIRQQAYRYNSQVVQHPDRKTSTGPKHSLAYGVGLIHGVAGSGALIAVVMAQLKSAIDGFAYLLVFAICCIGGMLLASGLLSIPFSKKIMTAKPVQKSLIIISSLLCLVYGVKVICQNVSL